MRPTIWLWLLVVGWGVATAEDESTPVFRSDVSMGRIDTVVMDRSQHPIGGLSKEDFLLRQDGRLIPIRDLAYEDLPVDVLLLLTPTLIVPQLPALPDLTGKITDSWMPSAPPVIEPVLAL